MAERTQVEETQSPTAWAVEWAKTLVIAFVLFLLIRTFLIQAFSIPSGSMEDTLLVGDYLMANKAVFGAPVPFTRLRTPAFREPRRDEVVVFRPAYNDPVVDVVKRIVGMPGDTVGMVDGRLHRNGEEVAEPYVKILGTPDVAVPFSGTFGYRWHLEALPDTVDPEGYRPTRDSWGPLIVPDDHFILLGDNREQSLDSRFAGFIPRHEVTGRPMFLYYSIDRERPRPFPRLLTAARWERIGRTVR